MSLHFIVWTPVAYKSLLLNDQFIDDSAVCPTCVPRPCGDIAQASIARQQHPPPCIVWSGERKAGKIVGLTHILDLKQPCFARLPTLSKKARR